MCARLVAVSRLGIIRKVPTYIIIGRTYVNQVLLCKAVSGLWSRPRSRVTNFYGGRRPLFVRCESPCTQEERSAGRRAF